MDALRDRLYRHPTDNHCRQRLAEMYRDEGMWSHALAQYMHLFAMNPTNACHCVCLGLTAYAMGDIPGAIRWYRHAIVLNPGQPTPLLNMRLETTKQWNEAEENCCRTTELDAQSADTHSNLGNIMRETARPTKAIRAYRRALRLDPNHINTWGNLGTTYEDQGRWNDAITVYKRALCIDAQHATSLSNLVHCLTMVCNWTERDALLQPLMTMVEGEVHRSGYSSLVQPHHALNYPLSGEQIAFVARAFAHWVEFNARGMDPPPTTATQPALWQPDVERLRVGYMSSDFGNHPLSQLMQHSFGMHNRARVEVFGYALSANDGTTARRVIEAGMEHFFDVHRHSNQAICDLIRGHGIHILVDLNGYTRGARPEILTMRPAFIQAHYMGFAGTLGTSCIDYLITDPVASPPETFSLYTEKLAMMPHSFFVNDHMQSYPVDFAAKELVTRRDLGLPPNRFIYACFNQLAKIDPSVFKVWARLLQKNTNTVLWLLRFPPAAEALLRHTAETTYRLSPDRLCFTSVSADKDRYMRFIHCADLALDTPRYNGHTTACDILWAGVPIVTQCGTHMASRVCASVLTALQCTELICTDLLAYESVAERLAMPDSHSELMALRNKVRANRLTTPLFDTKQWVHNVESLYGRMVLRGQPPDHLPWL